MSVNKNDREAVYLSTEGRSAQSGEPLGENWHVDHRIPRSAGGSDDVTNLQPLTVGENLAKSSAHPPALREWQQRFLERYGKRGQENFLLVALPGAGKTIAALTVAQGWIREEPRRRKVLIVVPTDALRTQWQCEAAQLFGLQFQTHEFTGWKPSMVGAVVTYQGVNTGNSVALWKLRCRDHDVLVICDEIHHAGDQNDWGVNLREALGLAKRRLLLSGTPFRSDSTKIPFVTYDGEGQCVADDPCGFRYDYPSAIRDGVIRVVMFQHDKGVVRKLAQSGEEVVQELSSDREEDHETDETHSLLVEAGAYTEELLRRAHAQLLDCRKTMPDAGGLVLCKTQPHAERIAKQLASITGSPPDVVVSDGDIATSTVSAFRDSGRAWVVAVRQISEGIDIKRLMVLVYLSNYRTPMAFRQAVGRIVRNLGTEHDQQAYCFIPDHPTLVRFAREITNAQDQAITEETREPGDPREARERHLWDDIVLGTEHTGSAGAIIEGESLKPIESERVSALAREVRCTEAVALRFIQLYLQTSQPPAESVTAGQRAPTRPLEIQMDSARADLQKIVKQAAFRLFPEDDPNRFARANQLVNSHVGKERRAFTVEDCRKAMVHLRKLMERTGDT